MHSTSRNGLVAAAMLAAATALVAGCGTVGGTAQAPRTITSTVTVDPTTTTHQAQPTTTTRTAPTPIPANGNGYTFVKTKSGKTMCQVSATAVGCQVLFDGFHPRTDDGLDANGVNVTRDGQLQYIQGNLGMAPFQALDYGTYTARGWTITTSAQGTEFRNDATGHGVYVAIQGVHKF